MKILVFFNREADLFQVRSWEGEHTHGTYLKENKIPFEDVSSTGQASYSPLKRAWLLRNLDPWDNREGRLEIDKALVLKHLSETYPPEKMADNQDFLDKYWSLLEQKRRSR